jgi:hypothetical protein
MESFEKRRREKQRLDKQKAKAARRLQEPGASGPSEADYFADIDVPRSSGKPAHGAEPGTPADPNSRPGPDGQQG